MWRLVSLLFAALLIVRFIRLLMGESDLNKRTSKKVPNLNNSTKPTDPYEILGLTRGASQTEVREAYLKKIQEYHPDKVSHLGPELQNLARVKTNEIMESYNKLKEK